MPTDSSDGMILTTVGDATRAAIACEALIWFLGSDPRVQRAYVEWRVAHGLFGVFPDGAAFLAAVFGDQDDDVDRVSRLVCLELGLSYPWLPSLLLADWRVTVFGEVIGNRNLCLSITPGDEVSTLLPTGRAPRASGRTIARDVEWYYRAEIKRPRETPYAIGKEYAAVEQTTKPSQYSTVEAGIARVKQLLDSLVTAK